MQLIQGQTITGVEQGETRYKYFRSGHCIVMRKQVTFAARGVWGLKYSSAQRFPCWENTSEELHVQIT